MKPIISPSMLSTSSAYLANDIEMISGSEAGWVYIGIVDGVLAPNTSFDFPVLKYVVKLAEKPLDVYPMIVQPGKFAPGVKVLGAHTMNMHHKACLYLHRVVQQIREAGMLSAVTINPITPVATLRNIIDDTYMVSVMSVSPEFGGQKSIEHTADKVRELRELIVVAGLEAPIEVGEGVNSETGTRSIVARADVLMAGDAILSTPDLVEAIHALRNL